MSEPTPFDHFFDDCVARLKHARGEELEWVQAVCGNADLCDSLARGNTAAIKGAIAAIVYRVWKGGVPPRFVQTQMFKLGIHGRWFE